MNNFFKRIWGWLFVPLKPTHINTNPREQLISLIRKTMNCRYRASNRLEMQNVVSFLTTIFLSLGLIIIPLMQNYGLKLKLENNIVNMLQTSLAIAVLVFSVVICKSRYKIRSKELNECGNKLKSLHKEIEYKDNELSIEDIDNFQNQYAKILDISENHHRIDYELSKLNMPYDYHISRMYRLYSTIFLYGKLFILYYGIAALIFGSEVVFIYRLLR